jgi:hypothetical protein
MIITEFDLRFTEPELADALAKAAPPEGFKIIASSPMINASDGAAIMHHIVIHLPHGISIDDTISLNDPAFVFIIGWITKHLADKVKHRKDKKARIDNDIIVLNEREISGVIRKQIAAQIARERQWAENHQPRSSDEHH